MAKTAGAGFPAAWGLQGMSRARFKTLARWLGLEKNAALPSVEALALMFCDGLDAVAAGKKAGVPPGDLRRGRAVVVNKLRPWVLEPRSVWETRQVRASSRTQGKIAALVDHDAAKADELEKILAG